MEAIINQTILKINKTNWKTVKFGDVVAEPKETCKDIIAEGIEHVVGLEHIDTGDLHLRKSATTEESTTFSKKFRKGDVLFGRRRAYLKKAAQADFDGICSGDITVFRAKKELSSALLPFIVNNDTFFDYAVKHSAGGLSPRVKFKDLANYEFLLPPKAEQARLAELLWAMDEVIEKEKTLKNEISKYYTAISGRIFSKRVKEFSENLPFDVKTELWEDFKLDDLCILITDGAHASPKTVPNGLPIGTVENMLTNSIDISACRLIGKEDFDALVKNNCQPLIGDVLFSKDGTIGKTFVYNQKEKIILLSSIAIIRTIEKKLDPHFCCLLLKSPVFLTQIEKMKSGTALKRIVLKDIKRFEILLPNIELQREVCDFLQKLLKNIDLTESKISASQSLQKSLINQIF